MAGIFATPRPVPGKLLPALGGLTVLLLALRFIKPHQHGVWHPWRTVIVGAFAVVALAASVYMVYLLEIVKLANPIIRRREEQTRAERNKVA